MAAAAAASSSSTSLINSLSSLSLSSSSSSPAPPPTASFISASVFSDSLSTKTLTISQPIITPVIRETDIQSVLFPALAFSNTLFFKTPYNVQVIVSPDESEESLIGRFRREVFKANVILECKRRRFFETSQEKRKRKVRDAARRRSRRRQRPVAKKDETPRKKVVDDEPDNWDMIDVEVPYCK